MPTLISPLARKLCAARGIAPETLRGTGPCGRIMAADVPAATPMRRPGRTAVNDPAIPPSRPQKDGYYVYDAEVNMKALADISLPIAVQCEKLLERRYSLFDYIVRAVVKSCCIYREWKNACGKINVLLFEQEGNRIATIADAADKSIYRLARETPGDRPAADTGEMKPHIIICDSHTAREQVAARVAPGTRPAFAFVARGASPKVGIRVGGDAPNFDLPYSFYASVGIPEQEANRVAARLQMLLVDPVSLLLL